MTAFSWIKDIIRTDSRAERESQTHEQLTVAIPRFALQTH